MRDMWENEAMDMIARAQGNGLEPRILEVGPDCDTLNNQSLNLGQVAYFCGIRVVRRWEKGWAILSLPNRKIGKYECVPYTRMEAQP